MICIFRRAAMCCAIFALTGAAAAPILANDLSVTRTTLSNGLRVIVVRDPLAPVVTAMLNYEVGSNEQRYAGQAHALEHMMFRGSKTLTQSQLADISELLGGNSNADTQAEVTQYFFTAPSQYLDLLLRMEASRAKGLTAGQKDWDIERGAIKNEVTQDESQPTSKLFRKVLEVMFKGTPYSNDGLGTLYSFSHQINSPQLLALYHDWYHPNNAVYVIVGDVKPETAIQQVRHYFAAIPSAKLPNRPGVSLTPLNSQRFSVDSDQPFTIAGLAYRFPGYRSKDFAAGRILEAVLSSQRGELYGLVARGQALDAAFQDLDTHAKAGSAVAYLVVPVSEKPDDALTALHNVLNTYRRTGVPPELVEAEKQRAEAAAEFQANSVEGLAFQWSQAVAVEGRNSPDEILGAIKNVTVADVNRVLRTYVNPKHEIVAIAAPKNGAAHATGAGGAAAAAESENNPTLLHHDPLPSWATAAFAKISVPPMTTQPVESTLSNGIRLIVVPEHVSHTVEVRGSVNSNEAIQAPPGLDGVGEMTSSLLPYGTSTYNRLGLRQELDKIAADVKAGTAFSLTTLSQHFDRGVELLAEEELHPSFPAEGFAAVKQQEEGSVAGIVTSPDHLARVALNKALFPPTDPEQRFATPATVGKVGLSEIHHYFSSVYRPDMTTIVVVGDIDPVHAKTTFNKYFGSWTSTGSKPDVTLPAVPNNSAASLQIPDAQKVQSDVQLVQVSSLTRTDPDYAPLSVANAAFGGSGSAILFHDVRDVHGLVYSVFSQGNYDKRRSTFAIHFASDPQKISSAQSLIMSDLKALAANGLSKDDLNRGRVELVSRIPLRAASFEGIARQLIGYVQFGLPLNQATIDAQNEISVTNDQIKSVVKRWIRPNDFIRVIVGPGPR